VDSLKLERSRKELKSILAKPIASVRNQLTRFRNQPHSIKVFL
jgi:hypothetical protein